MVRSARPTELEALRAIEAAAGALFREVGMPEIADDPAPAVEELAAAAAILVAVDERDEPVGYARIEVVDGHAHLEQLSVHPDHGRQGIGGRLLDAMAEWARGRGDRLVTLTTFRAVPFNAPYYQRHGWEEVPPDERGPGLVERMAVEAEHGLDPAQRIAMRLHL